MFLSLDDVASLSLVCKRLFLVVQDSRRIWKKLLWAMYPGTSFLEYQSQYSRDDSDEYNILAAGLHQNELKDEFTEPSSKKAHESTNIANPLSEEKSSVSQLSDVTDKFHSKIQNYWKRQFGNRYSIGIRAQQWLQRYILLIIRKMYTSVVPAVPCH